ncbi:MAG: hypothetical protein PWQ20_1913 [Thermotogaceae bacterium]|jgi:hypothetical protein|nr:hypothetical protein [Thermotogaceae bacterium]
MRIDNSILTGFSLEAYINVSRFQVSNLSSKISNVPNDMTVSNRNFRIEYLSVSYEFKALEISSTQNNGSLEETTNSKELEKPQWYELKKESDRMYALFVKYLEDLLGKQIEKDKEFKIKKFKELKLKAQKAISENGYWGPKAVSKRILDFAKSISNGDSSKINLLRKAVEKAFQEVKEILGGWLPEVSERTYELVMKGFEDWERTADLKDIGIEDALAS